MHHPRHAAPSPLAPRISFRWQGGLGQRHFELEAQVPGLAGKVFATFGEDVGRVIAKKVPPGNVPRLLSYAEKADSEATRQLLLRTYQNEGKTLFERIPPRLVLAGGLTAAMLYGTHNVTKPIKDTLAHNPRIVAEVVNHAFTILGIITAIIAVLLLWRFGLLPWCRTAKLDMPTASGNAKEAQEASKNLGAKETAE